jgi:hypothetical protein
MSKSFGAKNYRIHHLTLVIRNGFSEVQITQAKAKYLAPLKSLDTANESPLLTLRKTCDTAFIYLPLIVLISPRIVDLKILYSVCEIHTFAEVWITAILVKSQKAEIFQLGKRHIKNHKMIDNWGNAKIALPHNY